MSIKTVTVVGANGNLGEPMVRALVDAGEFDVSVLRRSSSRSETPAGARPIVVDEQSWDINGLAEALRGQDAVVVTFPLKRVDDHVTLAKAAAAAGVRRYIPADFGSVDARSETARALVPVYEKKETVRLALESLAAASPSFSYTSLVGGHFFDWGLRGGFLHVFLDTQTTDIFDGGDLRSSLSTLARYAEATVAVLRRGSDDPATANRVLFIQSFCASQNELRAALERATGTSWTARQIQSEPFIAAHKVKADAGDANSVEELVFVLGLLEGDWTKKSDFSMDLLGLKEEDIDEVVARFVKPTGA